MGVLISVLIAAAVALLLPGAVLQLQPFLGPAFVLTMVLVGSLVRSEHRESFRRAPLRPLLGLICQYTVMPLTAGLISQAFEEPSLRIGIVLVGCMPGAIASNVMTLLFKGDLILSITLTTLATLTCPVILAFWLPLLAGTHLEVPAVSLAWSAVWMVLLPAASGILLRKFLPKFPPWWDRMATLVASMAIVLIIMVVVAANRERLAQTGPFLMMALVALNLSAYGVAWLAGRWLGWPSAQRRTLVIEVGMQNAGLGSVLAMAHLGHAAAIPSAFYTALCVLTAAMGLPLRRRWAGSQGVVDKSPWDL